MKEVKAKNERKRHFPLVIRFISTTFASDFRKLSLLIRYMAKMKGAIVVDTERCKGCQLCIIACPQKVIALANKVNLHGYPYVEAANEEACVGCASCGIVCPDGCITVYRKKVEE